MSRNAFEAQAEEDPQEEVPLFESVQRELDDNEVDTVLETMSDREAVMAVGAQFKDGDRVNENIAKLKQEGLWATARFYERLLERKRQRAT